MWSLTLLTVAAGQSNVVEISLPWATSFGIGYGFNSATGEVRSPKCIQNIKTIQDPHQGDVIEVKFKGITDSKTLAQELDASAGASYSGFGVHASAHASYVKEQTLSTYEAAYLLKVSVDRAAPYRLDPSASWDSANNANPRLAEVCGDSFIELASTGGRLYAVFRLDKTTFAEHHGADVHVEGSGWGAKIEAALKIAMSQNSTSESVMVDILQIGGSGSDWSKHSAPLTASGLIGKASSFPADVDDAPCAFEARVTPYSKYFLNYNPTTPFDAANARLQMQLLVDDYTALVGMQNSIAYVSQNQKRFDNYATLKTSCLDPLNDKVVNVLHTVVTAYDAINANYSAIVPAITLPDGSCLPKDGGPFAYTDVGEGICMHDKTYFRVANIEGFSKPLCAQACSELPSCVGYGSLDQRCALSFDAKTETEHPPALPLAADGHTWGWISPYDADWSASGIVTGGSVAVGKGWDGWRCLRKETRGALVRTAMYV